MGKENILRRICNDAPAGKDFFEYLAGGLSAADFQSVLMEACAVRAGRLGPREVLNAYRANRFVRPSAVHPARLCEIDTAAYSLLPPGFAALEPSPLSPFGCASALGPVHQSKIVTTIRNTEVCSDVTNYLALECAVRRADMLRRDRHSFERAKLCASVRQVRAQPFGSPYSFAHFRVFALCTAGHDEGNSRFEVQAAAEHVSFYLSLLKALAGKGFGIRGVELETVLYEASWAGAEESLRESFQQTIKQKVNRVEKLDQNYYSGMGFHIHAVNQKGEKLNLADGGFTDWTQKLLGNRKERLMTSGIGTERLACCF